MFAWQVLSLIKKSQRCTCEQDAAIQLHAAALCSSLKMRFYIHFAKVCKKWIASLYVITHPSKYKQEVLKNKT